MADALPMFLRALDGFTQRVHDVKPGDWGRSTACADWDARALVNHVAAEQLWAAPLLAGRTIADVGDQFDGDVLGEDPVQAWDAAAADSRKAFSASGALDQTVHLSYADEPAEVYTWQMVMDLLIHGWDLAKGTDGDTSLDTQLVGEVYERVQPMAEMLAASGMFANAIDVGDDAPADVRLLALLGRRP
ncbi:MAG: hypothetical protein QOG53_742 [Frankiales bacterium]|jgi:uncharacterized protein (TIGR03086 family)|nr:hypothetical protein [Frankiales bacterium]